MNDKDWTPDGTIDAFVAFVLMLDGWLSGLVVVIWIAAAAVALYALLIRTGRLPVPKALRRSAGDSMTLDENGVRVVRNSNERDGDEY